MKKENSFKIAVMFSIGCLSAGIYMAVIKHQVIGLIIGVLLTVGVFAKFLLEINRKIEQLQKQTHEDSSSALESKCE